MADANSDATGNVWTVERLDSFLPVLGLTLRVFVLEARARGEVAVGMAEAAGMSRLLGVVEGMGIPFGLFKSAMPLLVRIGYWQDLAGSPADALDEALRALN